MPQVFGCLSAGYRYCRIDLPSQERGIFQRRHTVDIIVDCTPGKLSEKYKAEYTAAGIKAIWQGGEDHSLTGISFNAAANYKESWGAQFSRVVSCNTTGLLRTFYPLDKEFKVKNAYVTLIRRSADPNDSKAGPINAIEPVVKIPTHHGPDVQSVLPWININTMAVKVPTTLMHILYPIPGIR